MLYILYKSRIYACMNFLFSRIWHIGSPRYFHRKKYFLWNQLKYFLHAYIANSDSQNGLVRGKKLKPFYQGMLLLNNRSRWLGLSLKEVRVNISENEHFLQKVNWPKCLLSSCSPLLTYTRISAGLERLCCSGRRSNVKRWVLSIPTLQRIPSH